MKVLFSIIINALILYAITFLLGGDSSKGIEPGVVLGCVDCSFNSVEAWKTYLIGGIVLGVMNVIIRPIIKILTLPLFFVFLGLVTFVVNGVMLWLFHRIMDNILSIPGVSYSINGTINFIIAVAIFTILNMFYSLLFSKK